MRLVRLSGYSALLCAIAALVAAPTACAMRRQRGLQYGAPDPPAQPDSWRDSLDMLCHASQVVEDETGTSSTSPQSSTPPDPTPPANAFAQRLEPFLCHREPHYGSMKKLSARIKLAVGANEGPEEEPGCSSSARRTQRGKSVNCVEDDSDESWSGEDEYPKRSRRMKPGKKSAAGKAKKAKMNEISVRNGKGLPSICEQEWMLRKADPEAKVCIDYLDRDEVLREREILGHLVAKFSVQHAPNLVSQEEIDYWNKIRQRWESKKGALPKLNEEGRSINEEGGSITDDDEWEEQLSGQQLSVGDRTTPEIIQKDLCCRIRAHLPTRTEQAYLRVLLRGISAEDAAVKPERMGALREAWKEVKILWREARQYLNSPPVQGEEVKRNALLSMAADIENRVIQRRERARRLMQSRRLSERKARQVKPDQ